MHSLLVSMLLATVSYTRKATEYRAQESSYKEHIAAAEVFAGADTIDKTLT